MSKTIDLKSELSNKRRGKVAVHAALHSTYYHCRENVDDRHKSFDYL